MATPHNKSMIPSERDLLIEAMREETKALAAQMKKALASGGDLQGILDGHINKVDDSSKAAHVKMVTDREAALKELVDSKKSLLEDFKTASSELYADSEHNFAEALEKILGLDDTVGGLSLWIRYIDGKENVTVNFIPVIEIKGSNATYWETPDGVEKFSTAAVAYRTALKLDSKALIPAKLSSTAEKVKKIVEATDWKSITESAYKSGVAAAEEEAKKKKEKDGKDSSA